MASTIGIPPAPVLKAVSENFSLVSTSMAKVKKAIILKYAQLLYKVVFIIHLWNSQVLAVKEKMKAINPRHD